MKALLFPGQGVQRVGMLDKLFGDVPEIKNVIENFANKGLFINDILYCPHHLNGKIKKYSIHCNCRKPNTLMLKNIYDNFDLDLKKSLFVGDQITDKECAKKFKIKFSYPKLDFYDSIKKGLNKI